MANTNVAPGTTPAPKNIAARFIGVITSPRSTYEAIVAHPRWLGMLALAAVAMAVLYGGFLLTQTGQDAWLDAATNSPLTGRASAQQVQAMEKVAPYVGYLTMAYMLVAMPIFLVIVAGILFAVFNAALGGTATFKQTFSVVVHAMPIGLLSLLFTVPLNFARGTMTSATNLAVLLPMLPEGSFGARLLGAIDIFLIWQIVVLSIGLSVLYRRKTRPIAITLLGIYAVIAIVIAALVGRGAA
jgi:hypothetical protein